MVLPLSRSTIRQTTRATIGKYPDVSLADARDRAAELRRAVAKGVNPVEEKRRERQNAGALTFSHLAERYLNEHARRVKRSASADERNLKLHVLPTWGSRPFAQIERRDVIELVERLIGEEKATLANRVQALVSSIFTFAMGRSVGELESVRAAAPARHRNQGRAGPLRR
jgi:hypothetical protein